MYFGFYKGWENLGEISVSHGGEYENDHLLGYCAA
jgi:hypothetical protein